MDLNKINPIFKQTTDREKSKISQIEQLINKGGGKKLLISNIIKLSSDAQLEEFYLYGIRVISKHSTQSPTLTIENIKETISLYKQLTSTEIN